MIQEWPADLFISYFFDCRCLKHAVLDFLVIDVLTSMLEDLSTELGTFNKRCTQTNASKGRVHLRLIGPGEMLAYI